MTAAYPPPDATREQVQAWEEAQDPARRFDSCACMHMRGEHAAGGPCEAGTGLELLVSKPCACLGFKPATKADVMRWLEGKRQ